MQGGTITKHVILYNTQDEGTILCLNSLQFHILDSMARKKDEVEIRPDNVLSLASALRKVGLQRDKIKSSRYRWVVAFWN